MNKKFKYVFIGLIVIIIGLIITAVVGLNSKAIEYENYYNNEKTDFILDEKSKYEKIIEEEVVTYKRKATFLQYEGEATFLRGKVGNKFIINKFQFKLKNNKDREKLEKESEEVYENIKKYLKYDGPADVGTSITNPDIKIDPEKMIYASLLDGEVNIHYSFYFDNKIYEYALRKIDGDIYASFQYNGALR